MSRKMAAILIIPVTLLLGLATVVTAQSANEALDAQRLVALAAVSAASGELASRLSDERSAAAMVLLGAGSEFAVATKAADNTARRWLEARTAVEGEVPDLESALDRAQILLAGLPKLRQEVLAGEGASLSVVALRYRLMIAALLEVRQGFVVAGVPTAIAERAQASIALSQAAESAGLLQIAVLRASAAGGLNPAAAAQIAAARAGWAQWLQAWNTAASPPSRSWLDQALSGEQLLAAQRLDGIVSRTPVSGQLGIARQEWMAAQQARQRGLRDVIAQADADVTGLLEQWGRERTTAAATTGAVTVVILTMALWLAWFVARRTVRSLESLRRRAMDVARVGLPQAVEALSSEPSTGEFSGQAAAEHFGVLLPVNGADEVADVTGAFNAVQVTAVNLALAQVRARRRVAGIMIDLGRRQQLLVDGLIASIDAAEQDEQDPDRLARLFDIDHLATRMRRANANLLLLAGVPVPVTSDEPVSLRDVLMAAISQVAGFTEVEVGHADADVSVRPAAVGQVIQALTELIDNAVAYSRRPAQVSGRRIGDRVVVEVADSGIGMSEEALAEANELLTGGRRLETPIVRAMGLQVVARVAAEQDLSVRLRPNEGHGITAEIILLSGVLQPHSHRRVPGRPDQVIPPRLLDRRPVATPAWPLEQHPAAGRVTTVGLPMRQRTTPAAMPAIPAGVAVAAAARRHPEIRSRALSSMQRGIQAARASRADTTWRQRS